ncbi:MAG: hypothetical protein V3U87_05440 [Methylococcaceae bacterium]
MKPIARTIIPWSTDFSRIILEKPIGLEFIAQAIDLTLTDLSKTNIFETDPKPYLPYVEYGFFIYTIFVKYLII